MSNTATSANILNIYPPNVNLDPYAEEALELTEEYYKSLYSNAQSDVTGGGNSSTIASLSSRFNSSGIDETLRLLLSNKDIYASLIELSTKEDGVADDDLEGLYSSVLRIVSDKPRSYFLARMLNSYVNDKHITITENPRWNNLYDLTLESGLSIRYGQVEPAINDILATIYTEGNIPHYLDLYIGKDIEGNDVGEGRSQISASAFTSTIRQGMIDYLVKIGVQIDDDAKFEAGDYDEYFLLAYNESVKLGTITEDPIDTARIKGGVITWDFSVDSFETIEAQGILPTNIRAAGALDYLYYIGEQMRVFDVVNALVLRWATGSLDIPDGDTAANLYRFHKLRDERSTPEERAMLYRRVLSKGNGRLLSNMVVNKSFPNLWHKLMSEAAEYIRKSEGSDSDWYDSKVSRAPIEQATKNLQYNLTDFMTGMSHLQVTEDYAHLQEAMEILKAEEILNDFGGRRKSIWTVIEKVGKEDLGVSIPTVVLRTCAVEGNKIFQWIAGFNEYGSVIEGEFENFLDAAEAWIIAQASLEGKQGTSEDDDFDDDEDDFDDDEDDFDNDWDW